MSRDSGADGVRRVLFLCTGNTCRSPMAEVIARDAAGRRGLQLEFYSAGIAALEGAPASEGAEIVARAHGLDLGGHRATHLDRVKASELDLILGMDPVHLGEAERVAPDVPRRLITDSLPGKDTRRGTPVPDPFGGWIERYEEAFRLIEASIDAFLERLESDVRHGDDCHGDDREGDDSRDGR